MCKHCDRVIVRGYSGISEKEEGRTVYNALTVVSEEVQLISEEQAAWNVAMDKTSVSDPSSFLGIPF